jgi:hypothetical protein
MILNLDASAFCFFKMVVYNVFQPGTDPTIITMPALKKIYNATTRVAFCGWKTEIFSYTLKSALANYIQRWRCSCKF